VNEQLGRVVGFVEGMEEEGEGRASLLEGKEWINVAELWIKIATKVRSLSHSQTLANTNSTRDFRCLLPAFVH